MLLDLHKSLADAFLKETQNENKFITLRDQTFYDGFLLAWRDFEKIPRADEGCSPVPRNSRP